MKYILILAAVLSGDPATVDPRFEALMELFNDLPSCEAVKAKSTGEGKGEIEGKRVLRIIGQCQELSAKNVQELKDSLNR